MGDADRDPTKWSPFHDKRGVPVCAGDLVRSYHFTGARRKRYYLYHVAVFEDGQWMMVPTCHLDTSRDYRLGMSGKCRISRDLLANAEVISGDGPGDILDCWDRPRVRVAT